MSDKCTVFYSWQSDTPARLNRNFIEKALSNALKVIKSEASLEEAQRPVDLSLDKDTKGVAGSPPIVDTILQKIENCTAFVADLTFVAKSLRGLKCSSGKSRLVPNPNVLIEYGYALRHHSHSAIIGVMNTEYGAPSWETLPFDLRHIRWPCAYGLKKDCSSEERAEQLKILTAKLVEALGLILGQKTTEVPESELFVPQKSTTNSAIYWEQVEDLIPEEPFGSKPKSYVVPNNGIAYLRLHPTKKVTPFTTDLEAKRIAQKSGLRPLGDVMGYNVVRNLFGSIVYYGTDSDKLYHFTQLFRTKEIWGIDAQVLNKECLHEWQRQWSNNEPIAYIAVPHIEFHFAKALENFLSVAKQHLNLHLPLKIEAGLVGIKGYSFSINRGFHGKTLHDKIQWEDVISEDRSSCEILRPFFDLIWGSCGIERSGTQQQELVDRFEKQE